MKVKFTKLAALLLAGAALFATGCTDYEVDIQKNADAIASANQQISALQTALSQLESLHGADVSKLEKAISDLETSLKALIDKKADKDALDAAVARIKAIEDADFQAQINALVAKDQEIEKTIADLKVLFADEIAKLDTRLKAAEAAIKEINEVTIPAINDQIKALQAKDAQHDETLKLLSDYVKNLQDLTAGFPEGTTIKKYIDEQDASLKAFVLKELEKYATKAELTEVENRLDARLKVLETLTAGFPEGTTIKKYIDDQVDAINSALATLQALHEADVATLQAAIDKVKAEVLAVKASIRSLVFVPEVYVDGVEAILIQTLNYPTQTIEEEVYNTNEEVAVEDEDTVTVSPKVIAKYHVIPSNADLSFLDTAKINFVIRPNDPFKTIRTRAEASEDFNVTGKYLGRDEKEADVICIEVEVEGTAATDEYISVVALQVANLEETYTSDYACIFSEQLDSLRIAMPADEDYHYRRALEEVAGIANVDDEAGIPDIPVYLDTLNIASCDTTLIYDVPQDLLKITEAHVVAEGAEDCEKIDPAKLGLDWKFELVDIEDWELGSIENVKLEGTEITAGIDAMDLTPVVRTYLVNADKKNAQIAYIKFYVAPQDFDEDQDMGKFTFDCDGDTLDVVTKVYEAAGMSKETFLRVYPDFKYDAPETATEGKDTVYFDPETCTLTWAADAAWVWANSVDEDDAPGKAITKEVYFENPNNGAKFTVTLSAMPAVIKAYRIPVERYIESYWTTGENVAGTEFSEGAKYEFALYNVYTPAAGDTASAKCLFDNNINAAFYTDQTGVIDLKAIPALNLPAVGDPNLEITRITYFFCEEMEDIETVGDFKVEFEVSEDSLSLLATILNAEEMNFPDLKGVKDTIAVINNENGGLAPNIVSLNKESDVAKALLNTMAVIGKDEKGNEVPSAGELYIYIGAIGNICGDDNGEGGFNVNLYWPKAWYDEASKAEWQDHFAAKYRQPVYLSDSAGDSFIDAVDFGEGGSFITVKDLVNPKDWRARPFDEQKDKFGNVIPDQVDGINYFSSYWSYYGPIDIQVDTLNIKCNLGTGGVVIDLPVTIEIHSGVSNDDLKDQIADLTLPYREKDQTNASGLTIEEKIDVLSEKAGQFGFFTYKNNGTNVTRDFEMYVPVKMTYGWGVLEKVITVKVFKTVDSFQKQ